MIRLDLPKFQCTQLIIIAHVVLPADAVEIIFAKTLSTEESERRVATYGSRQVVNGTVHAIKGLVSRVESEMHHVIVSYMPQNLGRPPRVIKPVDLLLDTLGHYAENLSLECTAQFRYDIEEGWVSKIPIPIPFLLGDDSKFTHLESVRISKREGNDIRYYVDASLNIAGTMLRHRVFVEIEDTLSKSVSKKLLSITNELSKSLVTRSAEVDDESKR